MSRSDSVDLATFVEKAFFNHARIRLSASQIQVKLLWLAGRELVVCGESPQGPFELRCEVEGSRGD